MLRVPFWAWCTEAGKLAGWQTGSSAHAFSCCNSCVRLQVRDMCIGCSAWPMAAGCTQGGCSLAAAAGPQFNTGGGSGVCFGRWVCFNGGRCNLVCWNPTGMPSLPSLQASNNVNCHGGDCSVFTEEFISSELPLPLSSLLIKFFC